MYLQYFTVCKQQINQYIITVCRHKPACRIFKRHKNRTAIIAAIKKSINFAQ
jgi:hypothetical protein